MADNTQASALDERCSAACTRAGIAALLLAAIGISMLPSLGKLKALDAVAKYISLRLTLFENIESLKLDPCWKYLSANRSNDVKTLEKVLKQQCDPYEYNPELREWEARYKHWQDEKIAIKKKQGEVPLEAPSNLRLLRTLDSAHVIAETLSELVDDKKFLSLARSHSPGFDRSIFRWQVLRDRTMQMVPSGICISREEVEAGAPEVPRSAAPLSRKEMVNYLTIEEITTLARHELPELSVFENILREQNHMTLPSFGVPMTLRTASVFVELGILLSTIYFWLYLREARTSESFPAAGTLFGVFNRTRSSQILFFVLIIIPVTTSALIAIKLPFNKVSSVLIAILVLGCACPIVRLYTTQLDTPQNSCDNGGKGST